MLLVTFFCLLDQSIRDYFYKILLGGAWSQKKTNAFHWLHFDKF